MTTAAPASTTGPRADVASPVSGRARSLDYVPSLDGLRAVAVVLVMLYHADVSWARGGFLGVDVFFVLSGYLITSLLLVERARWGAIDLRQFWMRRARRLLPALFLMLAFVGLAAPLYVGPDRLGQLRGDSWATLLYVANWRFIATGQSYFDQFVAPSPLRHVWSLGIEEQWYWLFPLLLVALILVTGRRRRRVGFLLAALAVLSATEMLVLFDHGADQSRLYYGTDTRAQELLIGSVLAVMMAGRPGSRRRTRVAPAPWRGHIATWAGLLGMVAVLTTVQDTSEWMYRGGFAAFCVAVAALLWGLRAAPASLVARSLSVRPVVVVGLVSYGLYLWHWPVFLLLTPDRTGQAGANLIVMRFAVTGVLAAISYVVVERPVRHGIIKRRLGTVGGAVAVTASVFVVVGCVLAGTSGAVVPSEINRSGTFETRIVQPGIGQTPVLLVGDSPGRFLSWYLPRDVLSSYALSSSTVIGCGLLPQVIVAADQTTPAEPQCEGWPAEWQRAADLAKPAAVILSTGYWELYDKQIDGTTVRVGSQEYESALTARLEQVRSITTRGRVPLLLLNVPCMKQDSFNVGGIDLASQANDPKRPEVINSILAGFAASHPEDVQVLDDRSLLCPNGSYQAQVNGVDVRPDGVHVGGPGGRLVGEWLRPLLDQTVQASGRIRAVMVGDSISYSLVQGFDPRVTDTVQPWGSTKIGCSADPFTYRAGGRDFGPVDGCSAWRADWPARIRSLHADIAVVMPGNAEMFDRVVDGELLPFGSDAFRAAYFAELDRLIHDAGAARSALVTSPCRRMPDGGTDPQAPITNDPERLATLNSLTREYAAAHPSIGLIDLNGYLCPDGFEAVKDGITLRSDGVHFSQAGSDLVWKWLGPQVHRLASSDAAG